MSVAFSDTGSVGGAAGNVSFQPGSGSTMPLDVTLGNHASIDDASFDDVHLSLASGSTAALADDSFAGTLLDGGGSYVLSGANTVTGGRNRWIGPVTLSGSLSLSTGTLVLGGGTTSNGTLDLNQGGGVLVCNGVVTVDSWNWSGGLLEGAGQIVVAGDVNLDSTTPLIAEKLTISIADAVALDRDTTLDLQDGASLVNYGCSTSPKGPS